MQDKVRYVLQWADNSFILGHRLSEWCGHGPILEQDIAITNIALDLIGEARNLYQYAAQLEGNKTEDDYPFLRLESQFFNILLVEQPNMDWAYTIVRQFLFDAFHFQFLSKMTFCTDDTLKAIATKSLKEVSYHMRYSKEWMIRLGDGTDISHMKMQKALNDLYKYFAEAFVPSNADTAMNAAIHATDVVAIKAEADLIVKNTCQEATLTLPEVKPTIHQGKKGIHSEHMGFILTTAQYMQRAYPNMQW